MAGATARGTARGELGGQLETTGSLAEPQEKGEGRSLAWRPHGQSGCFWGSLLSLSACVPKGKRCEFPMTTPDRGPSRLLTGGERGVLRAPHPSQALTVFPASETGGYDGAERCSLKT